MIKEVAWPQMCESCEYLIERIGDEPSVSISGKDYFKIDCRKGNCDNGNAFILRKSPYPKDRIRKEVEAVIMETDVIEKAEEKRKAGRPKKFLG